MRRWLLLLLGGTLAFGLFCFGSGLLLGIYLGGVSTVAMSRVSPDTSSGLVGNRQAPAKPGISPPVAALHSTSPAPAIQPSGTVAATTPPSTTPAAPATSSVPTAASASSTGPGQPTGSSAAAPTSGGAPVAQDALPVLPVTDLVVGLPADEEQASPLRGQLVSAAVRDQQAQKQPDQAAQKQPDQAAQKQPASGPTPGAGSSASAAGANTAASPGTAGSTPAKPAQSSDGGSAALRRVFGLRVGAYLDPAAAQRRAETLANHGYRPLIVSSQQAEEGLTWYSVVLNSGKDLSPVRREAAQFAREQGQQPDIVSWNAAPVAAAGAPGIAQR